MIMMVLMMKMMTMMMMPIMRMKTIPDVIKQDKSKGDNDNLKRDG